MSTCRPNYRLTLFNLLFWFLLPTTQAFEAYSNYPGARALGLVGLFSAQADDSSAVYHNPAGMSQSGMPKLDWSIEIGDTLSGDDQYSDINSNRDVKSLSFYTQKLPYLENSSVDQGWGVIYFEPYELSFNIPTRSSIIEPTPYGRVMATYRQLSLAYSRALFSDYSVGVSIDILNSRIRCAQYASCIDKGPYGVGISLGLLYEMLKTENYRIRIGSVWRSRVQLDYRSSQDDFSKAVVQYMPDRPLSGNIMINTQLFLSHGLLNINLGLEQVQWNDATQETLGVNGNGMDDYYKVGVNTEYVLPFSKQQSLSLRLALARLNADGVHGSPDIDVFAVGLGYGISAEKFIDIGLEQRSISDEFDSLDQILSMSYSEQR